MLESKLSPKMLYIYINLRVLFSYTSFCRNLIETIFGVKSHRWCLQCSCCICFCLIKKDSALQNSYFFSWQYIFNTFNWCFQYVSDFSQLKKFLILSIFLQSSYYNIFFSVVLKISGNHSTFSNYTLLKMLFLKIRSLN